MVYVFLTSMLSKWQGCISSCGWIVFYCAYMPPLIYYIHSSAGGHQHSVHILIVSSAKVYQPVQRSCWSTDLRGLCFWHTVQKSQPTSRASYISVSACTGSFQSSSLLITWAKQEKMAKELGCCHRCGAWWSSCFNPAKPWLCGHLANKPADGKALSCLSAPPTLISDK